MIMFQGHCDTSMIKTFQLNAHIQFLHSLLILWPESYPLESTGDSGFCQEVVLVQAQFEPTSS